MTNIMPGLLTAMRQRGAVPNINYDAIVDSSEVHAIKPEAKIYEVAIERSGSEPAEILLVDDDRANVMAAEKLGMHVLWFDDSRPEESAGRIKQALEPVSATAEPAASVVSVAPAAVELPAQPVVAALPSLAPQNVGAPGQ